MSEVSGGGYARGGYVGDNTVLGGSALTIPSQPPKVNYLITQAEYSALLWARDMVNAIREIADGDVLNPEDFFAVVRLLVRERAVNGTA